MADYEEKEGGDRWKVIAPRVAALLIGAALVAFVVIPAINGDGGGELSTADEGPAAAQDPTTADVLTTSATDPTAPETAVPEPTSTGAPETEPADTVGGDTETDDSAPSDAADASDGDDPDTTALPVAGVSYPTLPDGSPVPALGIYDDDEITLTGVVQSEAAKERLEFLVLANSKNADANLSSSLTIDPTVPPSIGVRIIEMNSVRFPEGAARISPEHGVELDRVATVMNALPNTTVLVIGHSDQRGSDEANYRISEDRALAAANHLVAAGISPMRVSARAVGESDLLTLNDDAAALALNRRTEFVIYGLLAE